MTNETACACRVAWSPEDGEYVATCDDFPSLSWLDTDREKALLGLQRLILTVRKDIAAEG